MNAQIQTQGTRYLTSREFNAFFAETVKRFPCIWNRNLLEYRSLHVIRSAWQQIARILGNKLTPLQCQSKWRTMRNSYSAYLRKDARNGSNTLHMNGVLEFLRPYTASGSVVQAENGNDSSSDCEVVEESVVSTGAEELVELSDDEPEVTTTTTTTSDYYEDTVDYEDAPAACQHVLIDSSDGDALFLLSMLTEMEAMNEEQKRSFKETAQALIKQFL